MKRICERTENKEIEISTHKARKENEKGWKEERKVDHEMRMLAPGYDFLWEKCLQTDDSHVNKIKSTQSLR